jgi:AcrR family transcriptional regulator
VALATLADEGVAGFTARRIAAAGSTSVPAVYELFGDKAGLVREVYFEGFRQLGHELGELGESGDAMGDLRRVVAHLRTFTATRPELAALMFGRPFADFDPGPEDREAGAAVRQRIVGQIQRGVDAGSLAGDATDIAHALLALIRGLTTQEAAGWLGSSAESVERRWRVAIDALLAGFRPTGGRQG